MTDNKKLTFKDYKQQVRKDAHIHRPNDYGQEGEDHINLSIQSTTRMGKIFDPGYLKVVNYPHIGKFCSIFSMWCWLKSSTMDDNLRRLSGHQLVRYIDNNDISMSNVPNFKAIIAKATWDKLQAYPAVLEEMRQLPDNVQLLSYNVIRSSNLRVCTKYAALIIGIAREFISALKQEREPNFDLFVDDPSKASLDYLEGALSKVFSQEKIQAIRQL